MPEDHHEKLAPDEFVEPLVIEFCRDGGEFADADGTKAEMDTQACGTVEVWQVAGVIVVLDDFFVGGEWRNVYICFLKTNLC